MSELYNSMRISTSGLKAQSARLRVVAENIANADSVGTRPGEEPYRRRTVSFENVLDRASGAELVRVDKYGVDNSEFKREYDPASPAADADGFVLKPNISSMMEMMDMREARRAYEANLNMVESSKAMLTDAIDMLAPK